MAPFFFQGGVPLPVPFRLPSPCKVNFILNILGKRPDGYHELETLLYPVPLRDFLTFEPSAPGVELTCSDPHLPVDGRNLVYRAAKTFFQAWPSRTGARIHLEKRIPLAAGLGGGSANAAVTLLGLNQHLPASPWRWSGCALAVELGSDVPFFLQSNPALATGRGEIIEPLEPFASLQGFHMILIHPGFGISTPWAYEQLAAGFRRPFTARPVAPRDWPDFCGPIRFVPPGSFTSRSNLPPCGNILC